jgi:hypothetical protein
MISTGNFPAAIRSAFRFRTELASSGDFYMNISASNDLYETGSNPGSLSCQ